MVINSNQQDFYKCVNNNICGGCSNNKVCIQKDSISCNLSDIPIFDKNGNFLGIKPKTCTPSPPKFECESTGPYYCCKDSDCLNTNDICNGICITKVEKTNMCFGDQDCKGKCPYQKTCFCDNGKCH
jgi:hypothetical protein